MVLRLQVRKAPCLNLCVDTIHCRTTKAPDPGIKSHILLRFLADLRGGYGRSGGLGPVWAMRPEQFSTSASQIPTAEL